MSVILLRQRHQDSLCTYSVLLVAFYSISIYVLFVWINFCNVDIKELQSTLCGCFKHLYINIYIAVNTFNVDGCQQQVFPRWTIHQMFTAMHSTITFAVNNCWYTCTFVVFSCDILHFSWLGDLVIACMNTEDLKFTLKFWWCSYGILPQLIFTGSHSSMVSTLVTSLRGLAFDSQWLPILFTSYHLDPNDSS